MPFLLLFIVVFAWPTYALDEVRYESGLIRNWERAEPEASRLIPDRAVRERALLDNFFETEFADFGEGFEWKEAPLISDNTHRHRAFDLFYRGRRVLDQIVKTHFNRKGFLQYATSTIEVPFHPAPLPDLSPLFRREAELKIQRLLEEAYRNFEGVFETEPIFWVDAKTGKAIPALDIRVSSWPKMVFRRFLVAEETAEILEERRVVRNATVTNRNVYKISPLGMGSTFNSADITGLDTTTQLKSSYVYIRREENTLSPALKEVDPTIDYANTGTPAFSTNPSSYGGDTCKSPGSATCPNHSFDAVNLYYQLSNYRSTLQTYFTTLGVTGSLSTIFAETSGSSTDPLNVVVNSLGVDFDGDGNPTNETNNAAYVPQTCRSGFSETFSRCLVFLRPATVTTSSCGSGGAQSVAFYDLAREAIVAVHEYQHYITDRITRMVAGSSTTANVGDSLHEGYSDYFGASEVTALSGTTTTQVGAYGFQNCTRLIRDVATVRPYTNGSSETDPHVAGLSWASGLWALRVDYGQSVADQLALKSQFFLSARPGWIEAVEALVKADQALYSGAHVTRIRTLFYDTIKMAGGLSGVYRDTASGIADIGFRSCSAVHLEGNLPWLGVFLFFAWLKITFSLGRRGRRS